jgi:hypothetical protein
LEIILLADLSSGERLTGAKYFENAAGRAKYQKLKNFESARIFSAKFTWNDKFPCARSPTFRKIVSASYAA